MGAVEVDVVQVAPPAFVGVDVFPVVASRDVGVVVLAVVLDGVNVSAPTVVEHVILPVLANGVQVGHYFRLSTSNPVIKIVKSI